MRRAIQKYSRDFIALVVLFALALGIVGYIISHQTTATLPGWVPGVGEDRYPLKAELSTAQAVVPGQGQNVSIAGVKIGNIDAVNLKNGRANVTLSVDTKYRKRIFRNAHALLRPKTGLKDMQLEVEPGSQSAGEMPAGGTIPVGNTLPDVNLDQILASLDHDTRSYLEVLVNAGGEAFAGPNYSAELRETFKRLEPTNRDLAKITKKLSERRRNISRVVHNYSQLVNALGDKDTQLASLVDVSNANFQALASQDTNIRETLKQLPSTLSTANTALGKTSRLAKVLGPTTSALRPFARNLAPALRDVRPFLKTTTPIIQNQIRPFVRQARPPVRTLRAAAGDLTVVTPHLINTFNVLNSLVNELAYNPAGSEEGFLFWASWVNHAATSIFSTADAHGPIRRGLLVTSCSSLGVLEQIGKANQQLQTLIDLLNAPQQSQVCPNQTPNTVVPGLTSRNTKRKATTGRKRAHRGTEPEATAPAAPQSGGAPAAGQPAAPQAEPTPSTPGGKAQPQQQAGDLVNGLLGALGGGK